MVAPSVALAIPETAIDNPNLPAEALLEDYSAGCPGYTRLLEDLTVGYRKVFGEDVVIVEDSVDSQFLSVMARSQCDILCNLWNALHAFSPSVATGAQLDRLVALNSSYIDPSHEQECQLRYERTPGYGCTCRRKDGAS